MRFGTALTAALLICGLSGCGRDHTVACDATDRYAAASSSPPVRIPDDLSPPDESDSLRLPPEPVAATAQTRPCLQSPPGFYAEGAPGGTRLGNAPVRPTPAPAQVAPAAAPEPSAPPPGEDREIGNAPLRPTPAPAQAPPAPAPEPSAPPPADDDRQIDN